MSAQATILDRLLDPFAESLPPAVARKLADLRADAETQARLDELADKCNAGRLSPEERAEYEEYVEAIDFVAVLQAKARAVLSRQSSP